MRSVAAINAELNELMHNGGFDTAEGRKKGLELSDELVATLKGRRKELDRKIEKLTLPKGELS